MVTQIIFTDKCIVSQYWKYSLYLIFVFKTMFCGVLFAGFVVDFLNPLRIFSQLVGGCFIMRY